MVVRDSSVLHQVPKVRGKQFLKALLGEHLLLGRLLVCCGCLYLGTRKFFCMISCWGITRLDGFSTGMEETCQEFGVWRLT